jgi:tRNA U34 5-methylaminomethyl-2-thiouridine-forming methyltransferase MnmC
VPEGDRGAVSWTPVRTADGSWTLAHPGHRETCHSIAGAWQQACERYANGCRLGERDGIVRLLDVGTGIGLNLAAAYRATNGRLEAVSLERDPGVIEAGLALEQPPEVERWLVPVREALRSRTSFVRLEIGDARAILPTLEGTFDAVFLDPFSPRVEKDLWSPAFLTAIARRMAPGSLLSTYSASLAVRAALAAAGLRVGPGARVGTKASGTLASPDLDLQPFDARTQRRIERRQGGFLPSRETSSRSLP